MITFGLNQIVVPGTSEEAFFKLASDLGCSGVELRLDSASRALTKGRAEFLSGLAHSYNIEILSLSEISSFDLMSPEKLKGVRKLAKLAKVMGAKAINLIPDNNGSDHTKAERIKNLQTVLSDIAPILSDNGVCGLVEPLGFESASIRLKSDVAEAIMTKGLEDNFGLIHDTFHHALAGEENYYPKLTKLVHVSSVTDASVERSELRDEHRGLVSANDRLQTNNQIQELQAAGFSGPVSFEPFSKMVQNAKDLPAQLKRSIHFIESHMEKCVA